MFDPALINKEYNIMIQTILTIYVWLCQIDLKLFTYFKYYRKIANSMELYWVLEILKNEGLSLIQGKL